MSNLLFMDVETTGLDDREYVPIEIAGILVREREIVDKFHYTMKPVKQEFKKIKFYTDTKRCYEFREEQIIKVLLGTGDVVRMYAGDLKNLKKFKILLGDNYHQEIDGRETKTIIKKEFNEPEPKAMQTHGITMAQMEDFANPETVYKKIISFCQKHKVEGERYFLAGHNVKFDKGHFFRWAEKLGYFDFEMYIENYDHLCTLELAKYAKAIGKLDCKRLNLKSLCRYFDIVLENAHRADADIAANVELYFKLRDLIELPTDISSQGVQTSLFDATLS